MLPFGHDDIEHAPHRAVDRARRLTVRLVRRDHHRQLDGLPRLRDALPALVEDDDRRDPLLPDVALEPLAHGLRGLPAVRLADVGRDGPPERLRRFRARVPQSCPREARDREEKRHERERHEPRQREDDLGPETGSAQLRHPGTLRPAERLAHRAMLKPDFDEGSASYSVPEVLVKTDHVGARVQRYLTNAAKRERLLQPANEPGADPRALPRRVDRHRAKPARREVEQDGTHDGAPFGRHHVQRVELASDRHLAPRHPERLAKDTVAEVEHELVASVRARVEDIELHGPSTRRREVVYEGRPLRLAQMYALPVATQRDLKGVSGPGSWLDAHVACAASSPVDRADVVGRARAGGGRRRGLVGAWGGPRDRRRLGAARAGE